MLLLIIPTIAEHNAWLYKLSFFTSSSPTKLSLVSLKLPRGYSYFCYLLVGHATHFLWRATTYFPPPTLSCCFTGSQHLAFHSLPVCSCLCCALPLPPSHAVRRSSRWRLWGWYSLGVLSVVSSLAHWTMDINAQTGSLADRLLCCNGCCFICIASYL